MTDTIKCGRIIFELVDGDTIMDNGYCRQLITREVSYLRGTPLVSKVAFVKFKKLPNVIKKTEAGYCGSDLDYWIYKV